MRRRDLVLFAAGLVLVVVLFRRFGTEPLELAVARIQPVFLAAYLLLACTVLLACALRWWLVARAVGESPRICCLVAARAAGDAVGGLLPGARVAGDPVRIALVSRGLGAVRASAGVAVDRLVELVGNIICAAVYVTAFMVSAHGERAAATGALTLALLVGSLVALAFPLETMRAGRRPFAWIYRLGGTPGEEPRRAWLAALYRTEGQLIEVFRRHPRVLALGVAASLAIEGVVILEYWCLLQSFGVRLELSTMLLALVASGLARAVPTPAGLGALEAGQVAVLSVAGGSAEIGFVVGLVMRLHETLWAAVGLLLLCAQGRSPAVLRLSSRGVAP